MVLSNNDGCVVARSNESKALGIKMGTPFFQIRKMVDSGRLEVRSSNYVLYGDMSRRVMDILRGTGLKVEVYSIDEAFIHLEGLTPDQYRTLCRDLVKKVRKWTGIPVSIGIAPSKTLGKVANHFAKRYPGYRGVCEIDTEEKRQKALSLTPIDDVWGVGWRCAPKLMSLGVHTAKDFADRPAQWARNHMGLGGLRTWQELHGMSVIAEEKDDRRQSICTSRSFAQMIDNIDELSLRVADFAGICAHKLREEGSVATTVGVFAHTNRFRKDLPQYYPFRQVRLDYPSSSTQDIVRAALRGLDSIWKEGYQYKRAGVLIEDISAADAVQGSVFQTEEEKTRMLKEDRVSRLMDKFNSPGSNLLRLASQRPGHYAEGIRREHCSRLYSTSWEELIEVSG